MRKLSLLVILFILTACGETTTLSGHTGLVEGKLWLDCSSAMKRASGPQDDIGYTCGVTVTKETVIRTADGERLTMADLEAAAEMTVLIEPTVLRPDDRDKELKAKEVIVER